LKLTPSKLLLGYASAHYSTFGGAATVIIINHATTMLVVENIFIGYST